MAVTYSVVTTLMDAAVAALAAADYQTARDKAIAAQGVLSAIPDTTRGTSGGGSDGVTWDRVALSQFITQCTKLANAKQGIGVSKVQVQPLQAMGVNQIGIW